MGELRDLSQVERRRETVFAFVQARLGSERLPQKTIREIAGKPLIRYLLERLNMSLELAGIVVLIPEADRDSELEIACKDVPVVHGAEEDVAGRFLTGLDAFPCDAFMRICADSPVLDPGLADSAVKMYHARDKKRIKVISTTKSGFPSGQQVEIVNSAFYREIEPDLIDREHVTSDLYWKYPDKVQFLPGPRCRWSKMSVDTLEDFVMIERLVASMPEQHWEWGWFKCHQEIERLSRQPA